MTGSDVNFDSIAGKLAGVLGAVVSMGFLKGTWTEKALMALGGAVVSFYASPYVHDRTGVPEGLTGFLLGLFGMAVASKLWEVVRDAPILDVWNVALNWLRKLLGLPPKD